MSTAHAGTILYDSTFDQAETLRDLYYQNYQYINAQYIDKNVRLKYKLYSLFPHVIYAFS